MQAIQVKYLGPTNTKGARLKATAQGGIITIHRDYGLDYEKDSERAVKALMKKLDWGEWSIARGVLPNNDCVFVLTGRNENNG